MRLHPLFKNRYIPDIDWSGGKLITHDAFRLFERVFGRTFGIRAESSVETAYLNGRFVQKQKFYTVEAFLVFCECALRKYLKSFELGFEFVELPVFQFAGVFPQQNESVRIPIFKFAIANTATVVDGFNAAGTTCTISLTTSGSNRAAIGCIWTWNASNTYTNCTYAGNTMTELGNRAADGSGSFIRLVGKHDATTGTNNLVSNTSSNMQHISTAAAYSGVASGSAAAAFPDTATSGSSTASSITGTITTSVADSWVFLHARTPSRDMTASTNTYERCQASISGDSANLFDSNGARAAGSNTLVYTYSPSNTSYWVMSSMAPAASNTTVSPSAQVGTFSVPTYTVKRGWRTLPNTQTATFGVPAYSVQANWKVSPNAQTATFSVPAYIVSAGGIVTSPAAQVATFTIPTYAILTGATVSPDAQTLTFTVPTSSVQANVRVSPDVQTLTFSVPTLAFTGALWKRSVRNTGTWTRGIINNNP